jgi:hypothetical protein
MLAVADRAEKTRDDPGPVPAVEHDQGNRSGDMDGDHERQVGRFVGSHVEVSRPVPADQGRDDDAVTKAGDGEQLGDALQQTDQDRLQIAKVRHGNSLRDRAHGDLGAKRVRRKSCGADEILGPAGGMLPASRLEVIGRAVPVDPLTPVRCPLFSDAVSDRRDRCAGTDAVIGSGDRRFVHGQSHGELWTIDVVL